MLLGLALEVADRREEVAVDAGEVGQARFQVFTAVNNYYISLDPKIVNRPTNTNK